MKLIPLSQGKFAMVDDADYEAVMQFKWHAHTSGRCWYAARNLPRINGRRQGYQYLHRFLMPEAEYVDHRDNDGFNCQRYNMRASSKLQNAQARMKKRAGATSLFRGVSLVKETKKWASEINILGKKLRLGHFINEIDAALAYDAAARKHFGEWAAPNFP